MIKREADFPGGRHLILVVEDNRDNMRLTCDLLEAYGFRVDRADNPTEARRAISMRRPDLILMDISLQGMDGLTLTRILKKEPLTRDIPIVALTAHALKQDEVNAYAAGCDGFITKPINTRLFPRQIIKFLRQ